MATERLRALDWLRRHRRRLAPLLLLGAALSVARLFLNQAPTEQRVALRLTPAQQTTQELRVTYLQDGEAVLSARLSFPEGAPREVVHTPSLRPGRYTVSVELRVPGQASQHHSRPLEVPVAGTVRLSLSGAP